ncbi:MAG: membrane dipeptidase [Lachnospiraceae bacterium]|nr:membrane dipeptidase [Lachnospiraceae bacterium]
MKVVDMHCDTISALLKKRRAGEIAGLRENNCHIDICRMRKGDYLLQNFALFVELGKCRDAWQEVQELLGLYEQEILKNRDDIAAVLSYDDIEKNRSEGKISAFLTVEEGGVCGGSLEKLRTLYKQGVRMMTLTWNYPNEIGYPNLSREQGEKRKDAEKNENPSARNQDILNYLNTPNVKDGLTQTGIAFVQEMEKLGMIVDVSHLSDAGFYDVYKSTKKPFVASHSNARAICPCVRNLSDDMIRKLAERGGVTGLNFCADFLTQVPPGVKNPGTIAAVVEHAKHIVSVGGMECLGLGSDFDGIDTHAELTGADQMERLADAFKKNGFTEGQIDKIFNGNVLRVYREVLL